VGPAFGYERHQAGSNQHQPHGAYGSRMEAQEREDELDQLMNPPVISASCIFTSTELERLSRASIMSPLINSSPMATNQTPYPALLAAEHHLEHNQVLQPQRQRHHHHHQHNTLQHYNQQYQIDIHSSPMASNLSPVQVRNQQAQAGAESLTRSGTNQPAGNQVHATTSHQFNSPTSSGQVDQFSSSGTASSNSNSSRQQASRSPVFSTNGSLVYTNTEGQQQQLAHHHISSKRQRAQQQQPQLIETNNMATVDEQQSLNHRAVAYGSVQGATKSQGVPSTSPSTSVEGSVHLFSLSSSEEDYMHQQHQHHQQHHHQQQQPQHLPIPVQIHQQQNEHHLADEHQMLLMSGQFARHHQTFAETTNGSYHSSNYTNYANTSNPAQTNIGAQNDSNNNNTNSGQLAQSAHVQAPAYQDSSNGLLLQQRQQHQQQQQQASKGEVDAIYELGAGQLLKRLRRNSSSNCDSENSRIIEENSSS